MLLCDTIIRTVEFANPSGYADRSCRIVVRISELPPALPNPIIIRIPQYPDGEIRIEIPMARRVKRNLAVSMARRGNPYRNPNGQTGKTRPPGRWQKNTDWILLNSTLSIVCLITLLVSLTHCGIGHSQWAVIQQRTDANLLP